MMMIFPRAHGLYEYSPLPDFGGRRLMRVTAAIAHEYVTMRACQHLRDDGYWRYSGHR